MKEIKTWTDVWGPYFNYYWGYVTDNFGTMAFSLDLDRDQNSPYIIKLCLDIAHALEEGVSPEKKYTELTIKDGCDLYWSGVRIGSFRGWGHLTGTGGLNLPEERARELQDQMIDYVMQRISEDYEKKGEEA